MKKIWKSAIIAMVCMVFGLGIMTLCVMTKASAKAKTVHAVVGVTRRLPEQGFIILGMKMSIKNKNIVKKVKTVSSNMQLLNSGSDLNYSEGYFVVGKKAGTTKVTLKSGKTKYVYNVKVHSKKSIRNAAKKALNKKLKELGKTTDDKYVTFADFNGDGIEDLLVKGTLYGYNYEKKTIKKIKTGIASKDIDQVSVSSKNGLAFFDTLTAGRTAASGAAATVTEEPATDTAVPATGTDAPANNSEEDDVDGFPVGLFLVFEKGKPFAIMGEVEVCLYRDPASIVGKSYVPGKEYFYFHDFSYDQDDQFYEPFTEESLAEKLSKVMPDGKIMYQKNVSQ